MAAVATGRFLSEDPLRPNAGVNFYSYVENNPILWVDPLGREAGNLNTLVPGPNGETAKATPCCARRQPFGECYSKCMAYTGSLWFWHVTWLGGVSNLIKPNPVSKAIVVTGAVVGLSRVLSCSLVCGDSCAQF